MDENCISLEIASEPHWPRSLPKGEYKFRILKPESLYEPREDSRTKEKTMVPPIYCSHAFCSTTHEARAKAYAMIAHSFEFAERKQKIAYTHEQVAQKCSEVQEVLLPWWNVKLFTQAIWQMKKVAF